MTRMFAAVAVTVLVGVTGAAAASPPPRLAFVRLPLAGKVPTIYVLENGRSARFPTTIEGADAPAWSPDGRRLAFHASGVVYVAAAGGAGVRRLMRGLAPAWSPDGGRIAVVRAKSGSNLSSIWTIGSDGRRARRLTYGSIDLQPSWSRDGRTLAFLRIRPTTYASGIWTVRPDGTALRRILGGLPNVTQPVWSPTADHLVASNGRQLIVTRATGGGTRVVARLAADAEGDRVDPQPAWSRNGRQIAFVQLRPGAVGRSDIWIVGADGAGLRRLTRSPGSDSDPSWR